ncbi:unnamed protein product [Urochloa humidicola]
MAAYACSTASGSTISGTYYSSTYKSTWGSVVSSEPDLAPKLLSWLEDGEERLKKIERAKGLVKEFCHCDEFTGAQVEVWLSELGVGWVLDLGDDEPAGISLLPRAERNLTEDWIWALNKITKSTVGSQNRLLLGVGPVHLFKKTVLKMLPFVDTLLAAADPPCAATDTADAANGAQAPLDRMLQTLLDVRDAVFSTSEGIQLFLKSCDSSLEMEAQQSSGEVLGLLSAKEQRLDEVIWNTMEEVRFSILNNDDDNEWGIQTRQGSPDIC